MSRVDEIRARAEAATRGPWSAIEGPGEHWYVCDEGESIASISANDGSNEDQRQPDAEFIAHAREDIPWLLAELDKARAEKADVWDEGYAEGGRDEHEFRLQCKAKNPYKEAP